MYSVETVLLRNVFDDGYSARVGAYYNVICACSANALTQSATMKCQQHAHIGFTLLGLLLESLNDTSKRDSCAYLYCYQQVERRREFE